IAERLEGILAGLIQRQARQFDLQFLECRLRGTPPCRKLLGETRQRDPRYSRQLQLPVAVEQIGVTRPDLLDHNLQFLLLLGLLDVIRSREIRFAGPEIDHVHTFAAKPVGFGRYLHRGRNTDGGDSFRDRVDCCLHVACYAPLILDFDNRACSRLSTDGGTSPVIFPPRPNTSFTSRELMKEYASWAIMNTVSICGLSRRFMSAICSSYS